MIEASRVHDVLGRHQLADGFPIVMDLEKSHGSWIHDSLSGKEMLDFFTCFASWPVGYGHPEMEEPGFQADLLLAAKNNPANSDLYTGMMADFVDAFATKVTPPEFPHHFWVAGGALAVENAMKTAFDWKAHKMGIGKVEDGNALSILHFRQAFHGRSGYTMSVTNTDPNKIALFPKFDWPRVHNPAVVFDNEGGIANDIEAEEARACAEIEAAFAQHKGIAAILLEPMQGEGGDNHFRPEFLQKLRAYADEHEALLIFDEVQTGFYGSGRAWMWQLKGVQPDIVAFGKKTQVCGIYAGKRIDEVEENVFARGGRINSTWGGNLVDMVRCRRFIQIVEQEGLEAKIAERGCEMVGGLQGLARENGHLSNVRGAGSLIAFTLESAATRDQMILDLREKGLMALASGEAAIRFRMPLIVSEEEVNQALERVEACLPARTGA